MATMNIPLPDPMRDWLKSQIDTGKYANNSDYVRELILIIRILPGGRDLPKFLG